MNDGRNFDLLVARAFSLGLHFLHVPVSLLLLVFGWVGVFGNGPVHYLLALAPPYSANGVRMGEMIGWGLG